MKWTDAITAVQDRLSTLNNYVDRHEVVDDLTSLNQEYTPQALREQVQEAIDVADRMLNAVTDDRDEV